MSHKTKFMVAAAPLFLVLFIDGMGLGLLFPILNGLIMTPGAGFLSPGLSSVTREFIFGGIIGSFMLCWFIGAPILGDLSDHIGRKKSLMICLLGACLGYILSALAVICHSLSLLLLGRIMAGLSAGSQPIAQAAIVDLSTPDNKATNLALILLFTSLGFVVGPLLGGVLSDAHLVLWFDYTTPFYFSSIISLLNAFLFRRLFKETFAKTGKIKIRFSRAVSIFIQAFQHKGIRFLSLIFLFMMLGWSHFYTFMPLYAWNHFHYDTLQVSGVLAVMGLGFSLGCAVIINIVIRFWTFRTIIFFGMVVSAACALLLACYPKTWVLWSCNLIAGAAIATAYSALLTVFSNSVGGDEQGWVMGVTGAIMALCFGVVALLAGFFADHGMLYAAIGLALSAVLLLRMKASTASSSLKD